MAIDKSLRARQMRELPIELRDALIRDAPNCIDGRHRFEQASLARKYKAPTPPNGVA